MNGSSPESAVEPTQNSEQTRTRRAYKACLHCRARKAKCDLGDIDAPGKPPCARCRRERRECVFAPSFRGGKILKKPSTMGVGAGDRAASTDNVDKAFEGFERGTKNGVATSLSTFSTSDLDLDNEVERGASSSTDERPRKAMRLDSPDPDPERSGGDGDASGDSEERPNRLDPQSLAAASLRNPTDALNLLALAADVDRAAKGKGKGKSKSKRREPHGSHARDEESGTMVNTQATPATNGSATGLGLVGTERREHSLNNATTTANSQIHGHHRAHTQYRLSSYRLVKQGIISPVELMRLTNHFFSRVHVVFPMVPHNRIPKNEAELAKFAKEENYLMTAIVVITSRQEKLFEVHEKSWQYMQSLINELILGKVESVGAVEALLLLSENLPLRSEPASEDEEHRMSWMLVGMAVRLGYMLGLDQKTLRPVTPGSDRDNDDKKHEAMNENERLDREVLAWTYCYIFDRSISIRSGKAFWSRGPGLCFQRTYSSSMPNSSDTFPSLKPIPGVQDDFASMLQAYTELTQTMASAHDVLYPSKDRTIALVRVGDYHKYLDEFTRSINGFRLNWEGKTWELPVVTECVWLSFHYLRLYIYAFAFQAHVQRSTSTSRDGKKVADNVIFPRGPMGSPDARFILEAIDAATTLLKIAVDKLHPSGALSILPWRFFLYFSYAGVFLLKAVFVGAVVPQDQRDIVQLIKRVILCLACASSDEQHSGIRYARLLNGLLRVFSRGVDGVASQVNSPKRRVAELPPVKADASERKVPDARPASASTAASVPDTAPQPNSDILPSNGISGVNGINNLNCHPHANGMDIDPQRPVRQPLPPINTALEGPASHPVPLPSNTYYHAHPVQMPPSSHSPSQGYTPSGTTSHGYPHHQHQAQAQAQAHSQQMYAQAAQGPSPQNGYNVNAGAGFEAFHPGYQFQFDLNWPPMEPDGLAQMLSDDHSLDGDFWISLPNHAQWPQTWPVNTTPTNPPLS